MSRYGDCWRSLRGKSSFPDCQILDVVDGYAVVFFTPDQVRDFLGVSGRLSPLLLASNGFRPYASGRGYVKEFYLGNSCYWRGAIVSFVVLVIIVLLILYGAS